MTPRAGFGPRALSLTAMFYTFIADAGELMRCISSPQALHRGTVLQGGSEALGPHVRQVVVLHATHILLSSMVLFYTTGRTELPNRYICIVLILYSSFSISFFVKYWRGAFKAN